MNQRTHRLTINRLPILTGTVVAIVLGLLMPLRSSHAQQGYRRLPPPKKKSALDSLSALHKKVKHNLFRRNEHDSEDRDNYYSDRDYDYDRRDYDPRDYDRVYDDDRGPRRTYRDSGMPPQRAAHVQFEQSVDRYQDRERSRGYDDRHERDSRSNHQRRESDRELRSSNRDQYREPQRRQMLDQYRDQYEEIEPASRERDRAQPRRGEHYGARSMPDYGQAPPPPYYDDAPYTDPHAAPYQEQSSSAPQNSLRNDSHGAEGTAPPEGTDYRTGHYRNGTALTVQQFDNQETATQRVLKLQQENQKLIDTRNSMTGENQRLMKLVQEKDRLLKQIEKAIEAASAELKNANKDNEKLKRRIALLESEKADQLLASSRQMDAIRKQLDDVLMREITSE